MNCCNLPSIFAASAVLRSQFIKTFPFTVFGDVFVSALEVACLQGPEFVTFPFMVLFGKDGNQVFNCRYWYLIVQILRAGSDHICQLFVEVDILEL